MNNGYIRQPPPSSGHQYPTKAQKQNPHETLRSMRRYRSGQGRNRLPEPATNYLKNWLQEHPAHPYPSEFEKSNMCIETGLKPDQASLLERTLCVSQSVLSFDS